MRKQYLSAPLPFVGQKRMFAKEFIKVLKQYPDDAVFVDLFGGSGLLSHITKCQKPNATVVYNDYDNYRFRLNNIPRTNILLADLRAIVGNMPKHSCIKGEKRDYIFSRLEQEEREYGYIDFISISAALMFSMKYVSSIPEMKRESLYNNLRLNDYPLADDYLEGIDVVSADYKEVFERYRNVPNVVFLVDPPYLSTEVGTYKMYWRLSDYLDVLTVLKDRDFVYFTSNKSSIIELCEWIGNNKALGNPFEDCQRVEFNATMNYNAKYTDIMLYRKRSEDLAEKAA
ncbi:MAG: DNA adenine methylase [Bacteroidaceae bacterium]|nr:DNA adenine methylase [Bacteroidaceae bacterium]